MWRVLHAAALDELHDSPHMLRHVAHLIFGIIILIIENTSRNRRDSLGKILE